MSNTQDIVLYAKWASTTNEMLEKEGWELSDDGTLWLLDNNSSGFVNGVVVPVDGGFAAYSGV